MAKALDKQSQQLVAALISYFERERDNGGPLIPLTAVRERVANALGLSIATVSGISRKVKQGIPLTSPKKSSGRPKSVTDINKLDVTAIRSCIYDMYEQGEHITTKSIHEKLRSKGVFVGGLKSLCKVLHKIGFKWSKDPGRGLMELPDMATWNAGNEQRGSEDET